MFKKFPCTWWFSSNSLIKHKIFLQKLGKTGEKGGQNHSSSDLKNWCCSFKSNIDFCWQTRPKSVLITKYCHSINVENNYDCKGIWFKLPNFGYNHFF